MIQLMQNKSRFAFPFCWGQWNQETNQKKWLNVSLLKMGLLKIVSIKQLVRECDT